MPFDMSTAFTQDSPITRQILGMLQPPPLPPLPLPSLSQEGIQQEVDARVKPLQDATNAAIQQLSQPVPKDNTFQTIMKAITQGVGVGLSRDPGEALQQQMIATRALQMQEDAVKRQTAHTVASYNIATAQQKIKAAEDITNELARERRTLEETNRMLLSKDKDFERQVTLENMKNDFLSRKQQESEGFQAGMEQFKLRSRETADIFANTSALVERTGIPFSQAWDAAQRIRDGKATPADNALMKKASDIEFQRKMILAGRGDSEKDINKEIISVGMKAYLSQEKVPVVDAQGKPVPDAMNPSKSLERNKSHQEKLADMSSAMTLAGAFYNKDISQIQARASQTIREANYLDELESVKSAVVAHLKAGESRAAVIHDLQTSSSILPKVKPLILKWLEDNSMKNLPWKK